MKNQSNHPPPNKSALITQTQNNNPRPSVGFDVEYFDEILNRPDIPKDERHAALQELWTLIGMFIDVGWEVHELPKESNNARGQNCSSASATADQGANMLYYENQALMNAFIETALSQEELRGTQDDRL